MSVFTLSLLAVMGWKGRTKEMGKELAQEATAPTPPPIEEPGKLYLHQPWSPQTATAPAQLWVCYTRYYLSFILLLDLSTLVPTKSHATTRCKDRG